MAVREAEESEMMSTLWGKVSITETWTISKILNESWRRQSSELRSFKKMILVTHLVLFPWNFGLTTSLWYGSQINRERIVWINCKRIWFLWFSSSCRNILVSFFWEWWDMCAFRNRRKWFWLQKNAAEMLSFMERLLRGRNMLPYLKHSLQGIHDRKYSWS